MIYLVFNSSDGSFYMASSNINKVYEGNDDFISKYVDEFDPEYSYSLIDNEVVKGDKIIISAEEAAEIEASNIATSHHTPRMLAFPSLGEQLDLLYHDIENDTLNTSGEFYQAIRAIKDANPKSE